MPKMKTNRAAAKRFKPTKSGRFKRGKAYASHIFTSKTRKRKRRLRQGGYVSDVDQPRIARLLPYS
ncbi:MAG: 50S ribosomal protein L35 [Candidatus Zixiibacteriota bacterium]